MAIQDGFGGDYAVALSGARVFLGRGGSVYVIDVSDPASPKQIGKYQETASYFYPRALAASEDRLFVGNGYNNLLALDTTARIGFAAATCSAMEEDTQATIQVKRSGVTSFPVQVEWSAKAGTATVGLDFPVGASGVVNFSAGATEQSFTVPILDDALDEKPETILLELSNPSFGGAFGAVHTAELTITESATTTVEFAQTGLSVGEAAGVVDLAVLWKGDRAIPFTVNIATVPGTATPDTDYTPLNITLSFNADEHSKTIHIPILNDALKETDEIFGVVLKDPTAGVVLGSKAAAEIKITDNDTGFELFPPAVSVDESVGSITFTVRRGADVAAPVAVDYSTVDGSARAGLNYTAVIGTLTFAPDELQKSITIPILDDTVYEGVGNFSVVLRNPSAGTSLGNQTQSGITIQDNEPVVRFTADNASVRENAPYITLPVQRDGNRDSKVTVEYATRDGSARAGVDLRRANGHADVRAGRDKQIDHRSAAR